MDKTTKTVLIVLGSLLFICVCGVAVLAATGAWSVNQIKNWAVSNTTTDLPEVARLGSEIAIYTLPDGFGSPYGVHFGDVTMIGYASQSQSTHIILAQFPQGTHVDADKMLKDISQYSNDPNTKWYGSQTEVIQEKYVTIRGEETLLTVSEGTSSDGINFRTGIAPFQGNGGPALVMVAGPVDEWDLQMVEAFIASIQ